MHLGLREGERSGTERGRERRVEGYHSSHIGRQTTQRDRLRQKDTNKEADRQITLSSLEGELDSQPGRLLDRQVASQVNRQTDKDRMTDRQRPTVSQTEIESPPASQT